jgi:hypothetical protein
MSTLSKSEVVYHSMSARQRIEFFERFSSPFKIVVAVAPAVVVA